MIQQRCFINQNFYFCCFVMFFKITQYCTIYSFWNLCIKDFWIKCIDKSLCGNRFRCSHCKKTSRNVSITKASVLLGIDSVFFTSIKAVQTVYYCWTCHSTMLYEEFQYVVTSCIVSCFYTRHERQVRDWFLEIAFVCNVSMLVYVCPPWGY